MSQKRNRRAGVEDRWTKTIRLPDGTTRAAPSATYGKRNRWRARYVDDEGHEHTKAFARKTDAQAWLDVTAKLASGTYIAPAAGRITVVTVYESWSAAQPHVAPKTAASRRSSWGSRVEPQWGNVLVADVRTAAVRSWVAAMVAGGAGVLTIENAFGLVRQVLGSAVEMGGSPGTHAKA